MARPKHNYSCPINVYWKGKYIKCNTKMPTKELLTIHVSLRHRYFYEEAEKLTRGVKRNEK